MNNKEDQELTVRSWIFPAGACVLLLVLALIPLNRSTPEEKVIRARSKAEILAYQVAQLYRESLINPDAPVRGRGPASELTGGSAPAEGLMGQDPWGHAFSYRIQPEPSGRLHVEMRSPGPDGQTQLAGGDDVVLVLSF